MQPQFSGAPPVKWATPQAPEAPNEVPLRIDDNGEPVFSDWGDRPSPAPGPQSSDGTVKSEQEQWDTDITPEQGESAPVISERAGEVVEVSQEEADAATMAAYGKTSDELAVEAEAGYDPEKIKPVKKPRKRAPAKPKKSASAELAHVDDVSDEQLMVDYGVKQVFSTTDTAEFFDRTNQWLYWGLREGVFTHEDGSLVDPDRIGDPQRGRRRFTLPIIKDILLSSYRRGNIEPDELKVILRRIRIAELGGEWREKEGWHQVELGKRKVRWVKPENCVFDEESQKWVLAEGVTLESD